ncbi:MAG: hypothetical protein U9P44_01300 [archaeon]|nr:hypothetical protein [archaeon]
MAEKKSLECIAGDDANLKYYYRCPVCGTIVIEDYSELQPLDSGYDCPVCNPVDDFPFEYVTSDKLEEYRVVNPVCVGGQVKSGEITLAQRLELGLF